jgi:hypothetical protein
MFGIFHSLIQSSQNDQMASTVEKTEAALASTFLSFSIVLLKLHLIALLLWDTLLIFTCDDEVLDYRDQALNSVSVQIHRTFFCSEEAKSQ